MPQTNYTKDDPLNWKVTQPEMTLRDFFAGCVLIGVLSRHTSGEYDCKAIFLIADKMMKAREETK